MRLQQRTRLPHSRWCMKQGSGMRVADHVTANFLFVMKYYADYYNECVYSVTPDGYTVCKRQDIRTDDIVTIKYKRPNDEPWIWEENGVGDLIESMTETEFESFGKTWIWNDSPNANEEIKHSWRNFIKQL